MFQHNHKRASRCLKRDLFIVNIHLVMFTLLPVRPVCILPNQTFHLCKMKMYGARVHPSDAENEHNDLFNGQGETDCIFRIYLGLSRFRLCPIL